MIWLAILLVGVASTDLAHSVRPVKNVPEIIGAAIALCLSLWVGIHQQPPYWLAWAIAITILVIAWGQTVTWALGPRGRAWLPLTILGVSIVGGLGLANLELGDGVAYARPMLLLGAFLLQLSTGNVVVRLVLAATHTINPLRTGAVDEDEVHLKGGRLLGPMERLFILGLGLTGQVTAAAIVVAAKGLLRFPELQAKRDQERIHQMTEYFLVGSFLSWLFALATLALVTTGWAMV